MSPFDHKLNQINSQINRWRGFEHLLFATTALLIGWASLTALDVWLRPQSNGRLALSLTLMALCLATLVWLIRVISRRRTPAAVAALLENKFPQLDNHLINRVLFANDGTRSPWLRSYMNEGVPGLDSLPLKEIKNRQLRKYGALSILAALALLLIPAFVLGNAWVVAMQRVANPFSTLTPPTFASILSIDPANRTIVQGDGIDLTVVAKGRAGQFVEIDLYPSDDKRSALRLGQFSSTETEEHFTHRVARLATPLDYRFRVGDAYPTDRYTISTVPPLALEELRLTTTPPSYTGLPPRTSDGMTNEVTLPINSRLTLNLKCNRAIAEASIELEDGAVTLTSSGDPSRWRGDLTLAQGSQLVITARDNHDLTMRLPLRYQLIADRPPTVRLIAPTGTKATLPLSAAPIIQFDVSDDYGLATIQIEKVRRGAKPSTPGTPLQTWSAEGRRSMQQTWRGSIEDIDSGSALRIVALDNSDSENPNRAVSQLITFDLASLGELVKEEQDARAAAHKSLGELVARQRATLNATRHLATALPTFDTERWESVNTIQREIRSYAANLLKTQDASIGAARVVLGKALQGPLPEATHSLGRVLSGSADQRFDSAKSALTAQAQVLRLLTQADSSMQKGEISRAAAGLLAMLEGICKGQTDNLRLTQRSFKESRDLPEAVIDRQDNLAQDVDAMIGYCRSEVKANHDDEEFGKLMNKVADRAVELKIHPNMIHIAELMDSPRYTDSIIPQVNVTNDLVTLMGYLKEWREGDTRDRTEDALAILKDARQSLKKMEDLQSRIVDALRDTGTQGNKTAELDDDMLQEILELKSNMADAMLKTATDLQAMPDLDAVNELVTDTFQTYEEMRQEEGSGTNAVREIGLQKEDWLLETLMQVGEKADEMEMWLFSEPDNVQRNMEQIDKEEMLGEVGQINMPEELQDIIGDLLEQEEELADEADDSVTNQGVANVEAGWGISEGETVDYNASGKSGNDRPDHKDQDGRSQVGRAGMSDGEVMSRSGKINEGDQNLDKRRTQDSNQSGDVEEEGHTDAVATGGGKNSGYSQERGMEGNESSTRRDTKVEADESPESTRAMLTRNAEAVYAQAQLNNLRTYDLKKYIQFSRQIEQLKRQNASPALIAELHKRAIQALSTTYTSLENGISSLDMGALSGGEADDTGVAASPDEAPAEYRDMVSDYFKALGEME